MVVCLLCSKLSGELGRDVQYHVWYALLPYHRTFTSKVNLKASVEVATTEFVFLDLVEQERQRAGDLEKALLDCLEASVKSGFKRTGSHFFQMEPVSC